mgnify:CR=1 FL=1
MGLIDNINKLFDHRIRLGIMSILLVNEEVDFKRLKELLGLTDGNLASHLKTLEKAEYVSIEKRFVGRKPNTQYKATKAGRTAFQKHLEALELLIKQAEDSVNNLKK